MPTDQGIFCFDYIYCTVKRVTVGEYIYKVEDKGLSSSVPLFEMHYISPVVNEFTFTTDAFFAINDIVGARAVPFCS